jgi:hypothetical protein
LVNGPKWLVNPGSVASRYCYDSHSRKRVRSKSSERNLQCSRGRDEFDDLLAKFSLTKAIRVIAWVHRFVFNCRAGMENRRKGPLITEEINNEHVFWVKRAQSYQNDQATEDKLPLNVKTTLTRTKEME